MMLSCKICGFKFRISVDKGKLVYCKNCGLRIAKVKHGKVRIYKNRAEIWITHHRVPDFKSVVVR